MHAMTTPVFQVHPSGRQVLSKTSFWQITRDGRVIGWASGYQAALSKAQALQSRTEGGGGHASA